MSILVVNAGSSSVKFSLFHFDSLDPLVRGSLEWPGQGHQAQVTLTPQEGEPFCCKSDVSDYHSAVVWALQMLRESDLVDPNTPTRVVGHRLIHGGDQIRKPVWLSAQMKKTIAEYAHLAPLHIPAGLQAIEATEAVLPGVDQMGLFDTAFFADVPPKAYVYPVPYEWCERWGIRRYGFHGTSHAYCTARAAQMLDRNTQDLRLVICHLGHGASATAVQGGVAVTNTMGFTPLEGLMMGSRSGTVDPGILLYLLREKGLTGAQLDRILHQESGLLGVSGVSADFRQVQAAAAQGHQRAQLALDVYVDRVKATIGALTATLGGLNALVFTGGVGENAIWLRSEVCTGLECLGVYLDEVRNSDCRPDSDIATADSDARVLVIHAREDVIIAREGRRLILERGQSESE